MVVRVKRGKPRSVHVRTGCLTCKSRRVKCSEEKPTCTRCNKAGFMCQGYAVPKPWIFESQTSQKIDASPPPCRKNDDHSSPNSRFTTSTTLSRQYPPLLAKTLTHGNSDPFHSFAIQIGPTDNFYITYYQYTVIPQLYTIQKRRWTSSLASDERERCYRSFGDEAAAYSLLARNAAVHSVQLGAECPASFTTALAYQGRAHAALREKLALLDQKTINNETVIYSTMWAIYLLAITDLILKAPSAKLHLDALRVMFIRYIRVAGPHIQRAKFLFPFYADIQYACTTLSRPMFNILECFPDIENFSYSRWHVSDKTLDCDIHPDIEDDRVRHMILVKREGQYVHREFNDYDFEEDDLKHVSFALHSRNLWFQTVILNVALDALDELQRQKELGVTDYISNTRAFIAVAALHWGRFASAFPVAGKLLYDEAPVTLPTLRRLLLQHESCNSLIDYKLNGRSYAYARFWALFVGAQAEQNRAECLGIGKLCGDWFLNEFRAQAHTMGVLSWEEAVLIFMQFLYNDHLQPHISTWWR